MPILGSNFIDNFGFSSVIELVDKLVGLNKRPVIILKYLQGDLGICWYNNYVPKGITTKINLVDFEEIPNVFLDKRVAELGPNRIWQIHDRRQFHPTRRAPFIAFLYRKKRLCLQGASILSSQKNPA